ncbi:hypothetical protein Rsub_10334 [Raphidocelis subcapitata]|uniref:MYND-type domain-containing protein n=1 Tax=Raphidocelis subcapitata TaxID=307507 RepID=A0A2V0PIL7_9CHLO|nr:hypothetical protein Rsub_10334 [Raphidocelis subcapitata]|eukprot:GBF97147.1 hypothetical protein Rsub_10334 [Raphidocelis subcapitata]
MRLEARPGLAPEAQELISSWDLRSQALLDAVDSAEGGLEGAAATAAAELLQPLLSGAFTSAHPDLFAQVEQAAISAAQCCSIELDPQSRSAAAEALANLLAVGDCAASLLAAPAAEGAVEALIAAAKRGGDPQQDSAFAVLAALARADTATAERAGSPEAGLLPIAVEGVQRVAADGPQSLAGRSSFGPLRLLWVLMNVAPRAVRARAMTAPGVAGAAADLLMALSAAERTAEAAAQQAACQHEEMAVEILWVLSRPMFGGPPTYAQGFEALTTRGALPRVLALLRSPLPAVRQSASLCIAAFANMEAGRDALFKVPRAASELAAALRRAYRDGEAPMQTQSYAALALAKLVSHSEGQHVAEARARAAAAEGSAGSLLGALTGLIAASVDDAVGGIEAQWRMCCSVASILGGIFSVTYGRAPEQLRALRRVPRLAEACAGALQYWEERTAMLPNGDEAVKIILDLVFAVSAMAGFDPEQASRRGAPPPTANADTAAARAALRAAPGLGAVLQRFFVRPPAANAYFETIAAFQAKWLLSLPEVKAPAPAAPTTAAAAAAAAAATAAASAAAAAAPAAGRATAAPLRAPVQASAKVAAVQPPAAVGGRSAAAQPLVPEGGGSSSSRAGEGSGPSSSGDCGGAVAAAQPKVCASCGKSATAEAPLLRCTGCKAQFYCGDACALSHWPSHRAACKAARAAAAQRS